MQEKRPDLSCKDTRHQEVVDRFRLLVTKSTRIICLQITLLATLHRPTAIMESKPNEELTFGRGASFAQKSCAFDRVLANEKGLIGRSRGEALIGSPLPANSIRVGIQMDELHSVPGLQVLKKDLYSKSS